MSLKKSKFVLFGAACLVGGIGIAAASAAPTPHTTPKVAHHRAVHVPRTMTQAYPLLGAAHGARVADVDPKRAAWAAENNVDVGSGAILVSVSAKEQLQVYAGATDVCAILSGADSGSSFCTKSAGAISGIDPPVSLDTGDKNYRLWGLLPVGTTGVVVVTADGTKQPIKLTNGGYVVHLTGAPQYLYWTTPAGEPQQLSF